VSALRKFSLTPRRIAGRQTTEPLAPKNSGWVQDMKKHLIWLPHAGIRLGSTYAGGIDSGFAGRMNRIWAIALWGDPAFGSPDISRYDSRTGYSPLGDAQFY